ncbi:class I SAM-dependent methyltransferase [Nocardioides jishulii]|uniref:Class I SAM-dependent methyltransferase n=1 Tax=Nocardioides jishulii TaxID=2575440 RepID=A0A4U2YIX4_9ACTN|nr:class I SAM-dependent methyltransferase [Nocardioides jishulii]QCX28166.1 class I SAM-dependent methyltransferase [Nocardioides jishulii]TKI60830.1 class I SAM-dependent methyltransferase [Nocardioides jishulii]
MTDHQHDHGDHGDHSAGDGDSPDYFEAPGWEERYSGEEKIWSGEPNPTLVAEVTSLTPGTALDVGCGEGGDVIWLAQHGWQVTGADFSANGLARAARHAEEAGVADRTDWWQVDAREFDSGGRQWDLVTTHFLHPPEGGMVEVVRRLVDAVAPGGHLLVVGHAPSESFSQLSGPQHLAMFVAADLLPVLPDHFEVFVVDQRPRTVVRDGVTMEIEDSTLLARRVGM